MSVADDCETWLPALTNWAAQRCHDPDDAVQNGLIRCWRAEQRGQEISRSYAFSAVRSAIIDQYRRIPRCLPLSDSLPAHEHNWDAGMEAEWLLSAMTPRQAEAIRLMAAGYRHREIATQLTVCPDAVKKLIHRGRAKAHRC